MKTYQKGLAVALIHVVIVLSLDAKLLYDRHTRPRVWVRTVSVDPDLPIRGRYLTLNVEAQAGWNTEAESRYEEDVVLSVRDGKLMAERADDETGITVSRWRNTRADPGMVVLNQPIAFFLPEHAEVPLLRPRDGQEMWAEVTVPRKGPPRPIQLAIKDASGWHPLNLK